jgi:hypothetical protein
MGVNLAHGEVYAMQHYVIKFVSNEFSPCISVSFTKLTTTI